MYRAFLISLNKFLSFMCHIFKKNGSVYPGSITFNLNRKILTKIKYPSLVIGVTGSSGKGTTSNLIYNVLKKTNKKIVFNDSGSNGVRALATLILNNCNIFGKLKADILLLEIDERHIHMAFPKDVLTHLVITNVTRDQPARNQHPNYISNYIFNSISSYTTLIINGDDPILKSNSLKFDGKVITYGLDKTKDSYKKVVINNLDQTYCPVCHTKLKYHYYHYGQMGNYYCPNNDFLRDPLDYMATNIDLSQSKFNLLNEEIHLTKDALYNVYATTAAISLLKTIGINTKLITKSLNDKSLKAKRGNIYKYNNQLFMMLESKNENALSYYQSLKYINSIKKEKVVILGFDNVSRRYLYNDLSWLYDVEFELLNNQYINKIIIIGRFGYDIKNRLNYANIPEEKLMIIKDLNELSTVIKKLNLPVYTMVCFDMTANIKAILKEDLHD